MLSVGLRCTGSVVLGWSILNMVVLAVNADEIDDLVTLQKQMFALRDAGKYQQAIPLAQQLVARAERALKDKPLLIAGYLNELARLYDDQGRHAEAEPLHKRALAMHEEILGREHPDVGASLHNLANVYANQARYAEAEPLYKRALAIWEKALGSEHPHVAQCLNNLAIVYYQQGHYAEAERLYKQALAIREKALGREHSDVARSLHNLAIMYTIQGRYAEAEPLCKRALAMTEKTLGQEHPDMASNLGNLANVYRSQGRYADAVPLYKRALAIREQVLGSEHPDVAQSLYAIAAVYSDQGRNAEAEPLYKRARAVWEKALGSEHPDVAQSLSSLASLYNEQGRYAEAEPLLQRALAIWEKALGSEHPDVAQSLNNLANGYNGQGRYAEAEPLLQRALAIWGKAYGMDHPLVAVDLNDLADMYYRQGRYAEAASLVDRAIGIRERVGVPPGDRCGSYLLRARIAWKLNRQGEAVADLRQAMQLAEQQRGQLSGGDQDRAQGFSRFASTYEQMVEWQTELGDVGAALAAIERSRARSLMDQMSAAHIDLLTGIPAEQAGPLRAREAAAQTQIASVEKQLELSRSRTHLSNDEREKQITGLQKKLVAARQAYADAFAAIRQASPAYRQMVGQDFKSVSLAEIQSRLAGDNQLVLEYLLGSDGAYLLAIPPQGQKARIVKLTLTDEQAVKLGAKAGPLTDAQMRAILSNEAGTGLLQQLRSAEKAEATTNRLAVLWEVLVPEAERKLLVEGKLKRCIVIPDATLAAFPFETLVVEQGEMSKYLLDVGPPIITAPSATLLMNLSEVKTAAKEDLATSPKKSALLSVADPNYGVPSADSGLAIVELSARSRYGALHGDLKALPYTGWECSWVTESFRKAGFDAGVLQKASAREASVRRYAPGRTYLHFACHGMVDQSYGNLFGALALTPGPRGSADPADDGFLTLAEIYALNLRGTELSILSACDTNYGPNQKGEGAWSLSRGFLVAGSKRIIASNWLVDDEAGASLVSVFCSELVKEKPEESVDYAAKLQAAKRWVRKQEKWRSPYYWGTFVLVGPN